MSLLQIRVGSILCIASPVVTQRDNFIIGVVRSYAGGTASVFVDVVTQVYYKVQVWPFADFSVGVKIAAGIVGA